VTAPSASIIARLGRFTTRELSSNSLGVGSGGFVPSRDVQTAHARLRGRGRGDHRQDCPDRNRPDYAAGVEATTAKIALIETEEAGLVADLQTARARAAAAALFADDGRVERADRAEAHLSRELDRALGQLARLRALRRRPSGPTY
jgi:hypothetical protein